VRLGFFYKNALYKFTVITNRQTDRQAEALTLAVRLSMDYNSTVLPPFDDPHYDYGPMYLCGAVCLTEAYIPAWGVCLAEALYTCVGPSASLRPYIPAWGRLPP